jgi:hypothetical protein
VVERFTFSRVVFQNRMRESALDQSWSTRVTALLQLVGTALQIARREFDEPIPTCGPSIPRTTELRHHGLETAVLPG